MTLHPEWKAILTRAWSVRLIAASLVLSAAEVAFPYFDLSFLPPNVYAALVGSLSLLAGIARFVAQKDVP